MEIYSPRRRRLHTASYNRMQRAERRVHLRNLRTALWLPHALVAVMEHMLAIEHTFRLQAESRDMLVPR